MNWLPGSRHPLVGLAFAAAAGILLADWLRVPFPATTIGIVLLVLVGAALLVRPHNLLSYVFVAAGFLLVHELGTTDTPGQQLSNHLAESGAVVSVHGIVASEPNVAPSGLASFILKLRNIDTGSGAEPSAAELFVRWRGRPALGDEVQLFGVCVRVMPPRNPGEFDMQSYLARRDIYRTLIVRYGENGKIVRHTQRSLIVQLAQKTRGWMETALARGLEDSPAVRTFLNGVVLGQRHDAHQEQIEEPFQQTGTLHLFAVAGLHVGIIASLLLVVATVAQLPRRTAASIIIPLLLFYSAITGLHVSSIRAAIMSGIVMGGYFFERKAFSLNSLAAAAFVLLCIDTNELFATGFQLSFAVVGTIVILSDPLAKFLQRSTAPDPFLPRSLVSRPRRTLQKAFNKLAAGLAVSTAAWIGSFIPIWWYFHLVAPISLVANMVVVPVAYCVLALAMLSLVTTPLSGSIALLLNNTNWLLATFVIVVVQWFAQIPGGHYYLPRSLIPDGSLARLTVLDVGAGGAVHLRTHRQDWLFDCGSERDYGRVLRPYLHAAGVNRLDGLSLSHGDPLHIGGAMALLGEMRPAVIAENRAPDRSRVHRRVQEALRVIPVSLSDAVSGTKFTIPNDVTAEVLFPPPYFAASTPDDQAVVVHLKIGSTRILLMSDSGESSERALIASGRDLRSDIIVKGQNRSGPSCTDEFLAVVQPRLIIATAQPFPASETIEPFWAQNVSARGIKLFRQDESGAVELRFWPNRWEARAYLTGETFRSANR